MECWLGVDTGQSGVYESGGQRKGPSGAGDHQRGAVRRAAGPGRAGD